MSDFDMYESEIEDLYRPKEEPKVILTVEEAEILTRCAANEFYRLIMERGPVDLARQVEVLMYDLVKRIKQAEKGHEA